MAPFPAFLPTPRHLPALPQLEHLDGHAVQIGYDGITRPGEIRKFVGEGMPVFEKVSSAAPSAFFLYSYYISVTACLSM